jgi:hypothetical protein
MLSERGVPTPHLDSISGRVWSHNESLHIVRRFCTLLLLIGFAASAVAQTQTSITTERYDNSRTGAYLNERSLNVSNVSVGQFGKLFSFSVDGSVQAQPLYVPGVAIPGKGTHNVLYVATMNDALYAFDADNSNGGLLWSDDFRNPSAGVTPIPITDLVGTNTLNIVGNVGIESTPVIDLSTNTLYLVARTKEVSGRSTNYVARIHAIDITLGSEKFGGPSAPIQASVPGTGNASSGGVLNFDPKLQNQRSSLALANGLIVFAWGSHEDLTPWHGWIMAYNAQTLQQAFVFCTSPNGLNGGVWMAGRGPVVDATGNVYYVSGNGDYTPGSNDYGDTVMKLSTAGGTLSLVDWFTPDSFQILYTGDRDLGSTGPILIPGTNLLVTSGKDSSIYVMNASNMGHEQTGNGQIVQDFGTIGGEVKGGLIFWNRTSGAGPTMYVWPDNISLQAYHFNGTTLDSIPISQSTVKAASGNSGGVLTISANGSTPGTGIVWSSMPLTDDGDHGVHEGVLRAFDANDLTKLLWDSTMNLSRDDMGLWPKYSPPTVINGKVYMASFSNVVNVYGLFSQFADFGISATPVVQSVSPGGTTTYSISTTSQAGFNSNATYSVSGLPAGATASFNPASGIPPSSSTLTVTTPVGTSLGTYTLTITGTAGQVRHNATAYLNVANAGQGTGVISVKFVGRGHPMGSSEVAGVVAKSNWNSASGATSTSPMILFDESNFATPATLSWSSDNVWSLPITDQPGNVRMMEGYLDTGNKNPSTVTVNGLPANATGYSVFVYADGANGGNSRGAIYQISGTGIPATTINLTDPPNTNFSGTFTQANNSNGNYVVFLVNATSFTITAIPGAASDGTPRAPINGIQIVPAGSAIPDFALSATPATQSIAQGGSTTYTVSVGALNGFTGSVSLSASGLPTGATPTFNPTSITPGTSSTLTITTTTSTPIGSQTITITGTSGALTHTATVTLTVNTSGGSGSGVISIDFVGNDTAMANTEVAGAVAKSNWNDAAGASSSSPLALVDETGSATGATVTWKSDNVWALPITDQPGSVRMMKGYLDTGKRDASIVTVSGLASNSSGYNVYVYADGDNGAATRTATYQLSGSGITTSSIGLTDAANTNFSGTFTQANNSNGNYVVFLVNATSFTITAIPGAASDGTPRAPINGIQIVPAGP